METDKPIKQNCTNMLQSTYSDLKQRNQSYHQGRFNWKKETYIEAAFGSGFESPFDLRETRAHTLKYLLTAWYLLHLAQKDSNFLFFSLSRWVTSLFVLRLGRIFYLGKFQNKPWTFEFSHKLPFTYFALNKNNEVSNSYWLADEEEQTHVRFTPLLLHDLNEILHL